MFFRQSPKKSSRKNRNNQSSFIASCCYCCCRRLRVRKVQNSTNFFFFWPAFTMEKRSRSHHMPNGSSNVPSLPLNIELNIYYTSGNKHFFFFLFVTLNSSSSVVRRDYLDGMKFCFFPPPETVMSEKNNSGFVRTLSDRPIGFPAQPTYSLLYNNCIYPATTTRFRGYHI